MKEFRQLGYNQINGTIITQRLRTEVTFVCYLLTLKLCHGPVDYLPSWRSFNLKLIFGKSWLNIKFATQFIFSKKNLVAEILLYTSMSIKETMRKWRPTLTPQLRIFNIELFSAYLGLFTELKISILAWVIAFPKSENTYIITLRTQT